MVDEIVHERELIDHIHDHETLATLIGIVHQSQRPFEFPALDLRTTEFVATCQVAQQRFSH